MSTGETPIQKPTFWQRLKAFFGGKTKKTEVVPEPTKEAVNIQPEIILEPVVAEAEEPIVPEPIPKSEEPVVPEPVSEAEEPVVQEREEAKEERIQSLMSDYEMEMAPESAEPISMEEVRSVYMNRELSWIKFNERVLEEAEDTNNPLCERLSFASIYQTNLDEFFKVRVGKLIDKNRKDPLSSDQHTGMTSSQQLDAIYSEIHNVIQRRDSVYEKLMHEVEQQGIRLVNFHKIEQEESKRLEKYFFKEIFPLVEPNIVGAKQPFPFLQSEAIYAGAILESKAGNTRLGIIPCSTGAFHRLIPVGSKPGTYMLSEEMILHFLPQIFKEYTVKAKSLIRITRSANIDADKLYNEELDYREFMSEVIRKRKRLPAVRLEMSRQVEKKVVDILCTYLKLEHSQVFVYKEPLDLSFVFQIQDLLRSRGELFFPKRIPQRVRGIDPRRPIMEQIRESDRLLSYPYHSMVPFLALLRQAAYDENVVSIKMTLYRVSKESKVIEYLCDAAEHGKEVVVMVELKARFDEENNVAWSRVLEAAGCHVIYGIAKYKVHSKLLLVTRREHGITEYFTQVGTGNYNEKTARLYTDMCLMTSSETIGKDAENVFRHLVKGELVEESKELMVAPNCLQSRVLDLMDEQIRLQKNGGEGYIGFKVNSLGDRKIMAKIVEASRAGVKVDLIVRGICCLIPGVPGMTDNVRVISIVGRFLEHTRIYIFGHSTVEDPQGDKIYISSADFLDRNTIHRVEVAAPIQDGHLKEEIREYFQMQLKDNVKVREMMNDGTYLKVPASERTLNSQEEMYVDAYRNVHELLPEEASLRTMEEEVGEA